ncbi:MAG: hypothetical protein ACYC97_07365 [Metallibacterium sp.]
MNAAATPLPITPTQLTVFTSACAWLSNKSPISTLSMDASPPAEISAELERIGAKWGG